MFRGDLTPICAGPVDLTAGSSDQPFAVITKPLLLSLLRGMPDCQSAVLTCLTWHAARQERLQRGAHARRFVARLSGPQLAVMTGRALRTVRHALRNLKASGVIRRNVNGGRETAVYVPCLPTIQSAAVAANGAEEPLPVSPESDPRSKKLGRNRDAESKRGS
jgi:hypothetical protein